MWRNGLPGDANLAGKTASVIQKLNRSIRHLHRVTNAESPGEFYSRLGSDAGCPTRILR